MRRILSIANLDSGLEQWKRKGWPADLNNKLYMELKVLRSDGLNDRWWKIIVDHLSKWVANRPKSKKFIFEQGNHHLRKLNDEYLRILNATNNHEPNLENISWETLSCLFAVTNSIKGVNSPVFGSKLSHFIFPSAFPVIDNEVIGLDTLIYENYWIYCCNQWNHSPKNQKLIHHLRTIIGNEVISDYPWPTKITELCIIGNKARNAAA